MVRVAIPVLDTEGVAEDAGGGRSEGGFPRMHLISSESLDRRTDYNGGMEESMRIKQKWWNANDLTF